MDLRAGERRCLNLYIEWSFLETWTPEREAACARSVDRTDYLDKSLMGE